jgi:hypothetical protein
VAGAEAESRRLRAADVDALTPPSSRRGWGDGVPAVAASADVRFRFEPIDEPWEDGFKLGIVSIGVGADDSDGFAVIVSDLLMVTAGFADHTEVVVAIVDIGEAREQVVCGLFGGIEIAGLNHIDHSLDASVRSSCSSCSRRTLAKDAWRADAAAACAVEHNLVV